MVPTLLPPHAKRNEAIVDAYIAPFPTNSSREGIHVFAKHLRHSKPWLVDLEQRLQKLSDKPIEFIFWTEGYRNAPLRYSTLA